MISLCNFILPNCAAEHPHLTWVAVAAMVTEEGAVVMGCRQGARWADGRTSASSPFPQESTLPTLDEASTVQRWDTPKFDTWQQLAKRPGSTPLIEPYLGEGGDGGSGGGGGLQSGQMAPGCQGGIS